MAGVAAWPGTQPRLLRHGDEAYAEYRKQGGYHPLEDADHLLGEVDLSGLLGRGGAGFPLAVKLRAVLDYVSRRTLTSMDAEDAPIKNAGWEDFLNAQPNAVGRRMRPRKLSPVGATALAPSFVQAIALARPLSESSARGT